MKVIKRVFLTIVIIVIVGLIFRGWVFRNLVTYKSIGHRTNYVVTNKQLVNLIEENAQNKKEITAEEIIEIGLSITSRQLNFTASKNEVDPNKLIISKTAHCVGYASFCATICNYLFNKFKNSQVLIKQLLLNQHIVAGIGNIYACEILYDAKISPLRKGSSLKKSQIGTILKSSRKILRKAIKYGGSSINDYVSPDGTLGNFQNNFKVYGREGYKIKDCEIKKVILHGRSTFFCPDIQK